jgi:plastocyanin
MVKKLLALTAVVAAVFVAAHCNNDNNTVTGPPIVTATPSPGPGTPSVTPGGPTATMTPTVGAGTPTPTVTPTGPAATVNVGPNGGNVFVDQASGSGTTTIPVGGTVHWVWQGGPHSTTSGTCSVGCTPDGNWDSGIQNSGAVFDHAFPTAGTFPYFCSVHGVMMTGTVVVH